MLEPLKKIVPDYAADLRANLDKALGQWELNPAQIWGSALAAALAVKQPRSIQAIREIAATHLDDKQLSATHAAATMMGANNIYWRFWYLVDDKEYRDIAPAFSDEIMRNHGIDERDFECFCLAVSAINNCAGCLKVHSRALLKLGFSKPQVMEIIRISAVVHSFATALAGLTK